MTFGDAAVSRFMTVRLTPPHFFAWWKKFIPNHTEALGTPERDDRDHVDGSSPHLHCCDETKSEHGCRQNYVRQGHPPDPCTSDGKQPRVSATYAFSLATYAVGQGDRSKTQISDDCAEHAFGEAFAGECRLCCYALAQVQASPLDRLGRERSHGSHPFRLLRPKPTWLPEFANSGGRRLAGSFEA